jgi:hypothetical protein
VLSHGWELWQFVHEFRTYTKMGPARHNAFAEALKLRAHSVGWRLSAPAEVDDPAGDPLDQPQLGGLVAWCDEDVPEPSPGRECLEGGVQAVDFEATDEPRRMRGHAAARRLSQLQTAFVVVEPLRVPANARELQNPFRLPVAGPKDLEGVPAQSIALTERQEPVRVVRDSEIPRGSDKEGRIRVKGRGRDNRRCPRREETVRGESARSPQPGSFPTPVDDAPILERVRDGLRLVEWERERRALPTRPEDQPPGAVSRAVERPRSRTLENDRTRARTTRRGSEVCRSNGKVRALTRLAGHVDPGRGEASFPLRQSGENHRVSDSMWKNEAWIDAVKAHEAASS